MKTDQCSSCSHAVVCPHPKALTELQNRVDNTLNFDGKDVSFIEPVVVKCKHYSSKMSTRGIAS